MTKEECKAREQKIIEMRREGMRYNEIADRLGADAHNIRRVCKRLGVEYTAEESAENDQHNPISEETAKERFEAAAPGYEYVSGYQRNTSRVLIRRVECGHEFLYTYSQACVRGAALTCQVCRAEKQAGKLDAERMRREREAIPMAVNCEQLNMKQCPICGGVFMGNAKKRYCSVLCGKRASERAGRSAKDARRRRRVQSGRIDKDITLEALYIRDKGMCWICGHRCDWGDMDLDDAGTFIAGPWYPSIDHVYPLSKGGEHVWSNVRLAHFRCNTLKRDKIYPHIPHGIPKIAKL